MNRLTPMNNINEHNSMMKIDFYFHSSFKYFLLTIPIY